MPDTPEESVKRDDRPKSARYMPRWSPGSSIGSAGLSSTADSILSPRPLASPSPRSISTGATKTERWRETGIMRWPPAATGQNLRQEADSLPLRSYVPQMQPDWSAELWTRSLRKPGVLVQHPSCANHFTGLRDLHEDWLDVWPRSPREWPFSGSTASGRTALPLEHNPKRWVERPVATGKFALEHMDGKRYEWNTKPREVLQSVPSPRR